jgi:hypothetical protein
MYRLFFVFAIAHFSSWTALNKIEGALPPLYQSLNEYKALLSNKQFIDELDSSEAILDLKREHDGFLVTTSKKIYVVNLIYDPVEQPGPAKFHLEFRSVTNSPAPENNR